MQRFPCPFCGLRDEREFHFAGEAGKRRPSPSRAAGAAEWSAYLNDAQNPRGVAREIWVHVPCQEYFVMTRDTVSMRVLGTETLRRGAP